MGVEFLIPLNMRVNSIKLEEKVMPNKSSRKWNFWSLWETNDNSNKFLKKNKKTDLIFSLETNQDDKHVVKTLKSRFTKLENQCNRIETLLNTIVESQGIHIDNERQPIIQ